MAGGQTLFADVAPPTPLGLLDLMAAANDPLSLPDRLNLELQVGSGEELAGARHGREDEPQDLAHPLVRIPSSTRAARWTTTRSIVGSTMTYWPP